MDFVHAALEMGQDLHYQQGPDRAANVQRVVNWKEALDGVDEHNFISDERVKHTTDSKFNQSVVTIEKCRYAIGRKK
jgi:hypothetical protein